MTDELERLEQELRAVTPRSDARARAMRAAQDAFAETVHERSSLPAAQAGDTARRARPRKRAGRPRLGVLLGGSGAVAALFAALIVVPALRDGMPERGLAPAPEEARVDRVQTEDSAAFEPGAATEGIAAAPVIAREAVELERLAPPPAAAIAPAPMPMEPAADIEAEVAPAAGRRAAVPPRIDDLAALEAMIEGGRVPVPGSVDLFAIVMPLADSLNETATIQVRVPDDPSRRLTLVLDPGAQRAILSEEAPTDDAALRSARSRVVGVSLRDSLALSAGLLVRAVNRGALPPADAAAIRGLLAGNTADVRAMRLLALLERMEPLLPASP